jgi:DNA-binding response OmpR family regulator
MQKYNVLIVDDDEFYGQAFCARLEKRGFGASRFDFSSDILSVILSKKIDIILLDIVMPKESGIEVLKKIREKFSRDALPVIMVTGMEFSDDLEHTFQLGANDYISKPIPLDMAVARINAHISQVILEREKTSKSEIEAIGAMLVTYSHEINNPLCMIVGELDKLAKAHPEFYSNELGRISQSVNRMREAMSKISEISNQEILVYDDYIAGTKKIRLKS